MGFGKSWFEEVLTDNQPCGQRGNETAPLEAPRVRGDNQPGHANDRLD